MVPTTPDDRVKVGQAGYVVAGVSNNKAWAESKVFESEAQARDFMNSTISTNPEVAEDVHVIPVFEAVL